MSLAACGLKCEECHFYGKNCTGCFKVQGRPFWSSEVPGGICHLFDCSVNRKKFGNCGGCKDLPCKNFVEQKDPNITQEEHDRLLAVRVDRLKAARGGR